MIHLRNNFTRGNFIKTKKDLTVNISVYSFCHAVVDAVCAALITRCFINSNIDIGNMGMMVVLYNIIAFSFQAPFGFITDSLKKPVLGAALGLVLTAISMLFIQIPLAAIIFAGFGNAIFHVCGGVTILNLKPGRASIPGIYVAPGAIGLFYGSYIASKNNFTILPFIIILVLLSIIVCLIKQPVLNYKNESKIKYNKSELAAALLLVSVAVRSFVGFEIKFPWRIDFNLILALTISVFMGKALGGILSDKFGWIRVTVTGLILSSPLIIFFNHRFIPSIIGMFLFNMTMPVTLTAISNMLPGRSGLAFGLTTLALVTGAFPSFTNFRASLGSKWIIFTVTAISIITLYTGLKLYFKNEKQGLEINSNIKI